MNAAIIAPAADRLDTALSQRTAAITRNAVVRTVNHNGHLVFEKRADGSRRISFPQFKTDFCSAVEIVPVGYGRFGIIRMGQCKGRYSANQLLSALRGFRDEAADHLDMWRRLEGQF